MQQHLPKLLDKMCKYEMGPASAVEDTDRTRFCPQTDRRTRWSQYTPFQLHWSWRYNDLWQHWIPCHMVSGRQMTKAYLMVIIIGHQQSIMVAIVMILSLTCLVTPGPQFNIKMLSYQYRKSHCGDRTVIRSSYLHNGISYTGKMTSLYWIGPLARAVSS